MESGANDDGVGEFAALLAALRQVRRKAKLANDRLARRKLSPAQRQVVLQSTAGRCHICGGKIGNESWQADHVLSHSGGGLHALDNYLPAHALCNNYRWDYTADEFQQILKLGDGCGPRLNTVLKSALRPQSTTWLTRLLDKSGASNGSQGEVGTRNSVDPF